jgi:hypothetical protein
MIICTNPSTPTYMPSYQKIGAIKKGNTKILKYWPNAYR